MNTGVGKVDSDELQNEGGQPRLQISADRPGKFLKLALISFLVTFTLHPVAQPSRAAASVDLVILFDLHGV